MDFTPSSPTRLTLVCRPRAAHWLERFGRARGYPTGKRESAVAGRGFAAMLGFGCAALMLALGSHAHAQPAGGQASAPTVTVAPVVSKAVGRVDQFTGRIEAIQSVNLQARVEGYLEEVAFQEGADVKLGDFLYQIEKAPYEASLAQANAQLAAAQAALASADAKLKNQNINLQRQQTLVERDTVSQAVLDDATATRDAAAADVQSADAQIKEAEASVQTAKLNLSYTTIEAPIDGRLGRTLVTKGNLVSSASGTMATLNQLDPIRVAFSVSDRLYTDLVEESIGDNRGERRLLFTPELQLPNGKPYDKTGKITFASNEIDPSTGTITAYAEFPNENAMLLPGAFVVVSVSETHQAKEPVVPASALLQDREGAYVFVLDTDDTVEIRRVTIGQRTATDVAVTEGLSEGETVVVQGVQKIRPGEKVSPSVAPTPATGAAARASPPASAPTSAPSPAPAPVASNAAPAGATSGAGASAAAPAAAPPTTSTPDTSSSSAERN